MNNAEISRAEERAFAEGHAAAADALMRPHLALLDVLGHYSQTQAEWLDENDDDDDYAVVVDSFLRLIDRTQRAVDDFNTLRFDWRSALEKRIIWGNLERAVERAEGQER